MTSKCPLADKAVAGSNIRRGEDRLMSMGVADRAVFGGNIQRKDMNVHGRWGC
jgi:hypothetical protein